LVAGSNGLVVGKKLLECWPLHRGGVAVVVKVDVFATELNGDDTLAAAKHLQLLLLVDEDAGADAAQLSQRILQVSNWLVAAYDYDRTAQRLRRWLPGLLLALPLLLVVEQILDVNAVIDLIAKFACEPQPALGTVGSGEPSRTGLALDLSQDEGA
jgi:hypothetical protein